MLVIGQKEGRVPCCGRLGIIHSELDIRQQLIPSVLPGAHIMSKGVFKYPVYSLRLAIRLWMECRTQCWLHREAGAQLVLEMSRILGPAV